MVITIDDVRSFVESKGATLNSLEYKNSKLKLDLTCSNGHEFSQPFADLKRAKSINLCPFCVGNKIYNIKEYVDKILIKCSLQLIGDLPSNATEEITLSCANGHIFNRKPHELKRSITCGQCYFTDRKNLAIKKLDVLIKANNAKLLTPYISSRNKIKIECENGHVFDNTPNNLLDADRLTWCPKCSTACSKGEKRCLNYFESLFKKEFVKTRSLPWLRTPHDTALELDGYCEELKIAFEYQGEQHYKEIHFKGKSNIRWKTPKYDDLKVSLCKENNVKLFIIPYFEIKNLEECILKQIKDFGIEI